MELYEDVGTLYSEYQKNNVTSQLSELDFFKKSFKNCMEEMDTLRQVSTF